MLESKNLTVQTEGELCYITIPAFEKTRSAAAVHDENVLFRF